jgi:hypothetical protein
VVISNGSGSENVWYLQTLFPLDWLTERCRISSRVSLVQSTCWRMVVLGAAEHEKDRDELRALVASGGHTSDSRRIPEPSNKRLERAKQKQSRSAAKR